MAVGVKTRCAGCCHACFGAVFTRKPLPNLKATITAKRIRIQLKTRVRIGVAGFGVATNSFPKNLPRNTLIFLPKTPNPARIPPKTIGIANPVGQTGCPQQGHEVTVEMPMSPPNVSQSLRNRLWNIQSRIFLSLLMIFLRRGLIFFNAALYPRSLFTLCFLW